MRPAGKTISTWKRVPAAVCFLVLSAVQITPLCAATDLDFDQGGQTLYTQYSRTPAGNLASGSSGRNLNDYYKLRQYLGSPPRIPHPVEESFSPTPMNCLACHAQGGFSPEHRGYIPVTPHPDKDLCYQCHVPLKESTSRFPENRWQSIPPPKLGRSALPGSPPPIPHSLQLRGNCIACHTGPGAVVEIRVGHAARGNCRQCHVPMVQTEPVQHFIRK